MAFTARTFEEILSDMINYVQANTIVSDFTVGSVVRTILEAAAVEDDEQYFQMTQLLDAFSIITATGQDLDDRLADYDITRNSPESAIAYVRFGNDNLITDQVAFDTDIGATELVLFDTSTFPTSYPYTIRIGETTSRTQDISVIGNSSLTATLTFSTPMLYSSVVGDRVSLVDSSGTTQNITLGTNVQAAPTVGNPARVFATEETASILVGNYYSNEVLVRALSAGSASNVGAGRISQFTSSSPFPGAIVTNFTAAGGGTDRETDSALRTRALNQIQSLSRGTPLAIKSGALGVVDPATGQRVTSANLIEDYDADEINLYIDDGTGLTPDVTNLGQSSLTTAVAIGAATIELSDSSGFPSSGWLFIEEDALAQAPELVEYSGNSNNIITLETTLVGNHTVGAIVDFVEIVTTASEAGQRRFKLNNFPVVRFSEKIFIDPGTGWSFISSDEDYLLNRGTGEFQIIDSTGLAINTQIIAAYDYYTNLIAEVQKVLEGDPSSPINYPGVKAAGVRLNVEAPVLRRISVRASISAEQGFTESDISPDVVENIENYIRSLGIGEDLILSKLVDVAHNVNGLRDISIQVPTQNITILENELPIPFSSDGSTLVQVF